MRKRVWFKVPILLLVILVALFFGNEWRVERNWLSYAADARTRGVKLMLTDFAQPAIPDEQNFAALTMWKAVFGKDPVPDPFKLPDQPSATGKPPGFGDPIKGGEHRLGGLAVVFSKGGILEGGFGRTSQGRAFGS